MPIIKSAIKRVRQEEKRYARNTATKRRIKATSKTTLANITAQDLDAAKASLLKAISQIDKAIKKGTLHKNTAARKKSQLTRAYNAAAAAPFGTENPGKPKAKTAKKSAATPATKQASVKPATKKPAAKAATKKAPAKK